MNRKGVTKKYVEFSEDRATKTYIGKQPARTKLSSSKPSLVTKSMHEKATSESSNVYLFILAYFTICGQLRSSRKRTLNGERAGANRADRLSSSI